MSKMFMRLFGVTLALTMLLSLFAPSTKTYAAPGKKLYIVQMLESPVVAYDGSIAGLKATKPAKGQKINPLNADVVKYVDYLKGRHDNALNSVGGGRKAYDYTYTYNGFAAELDAAQANKLAKTAGVLAVTEDSMAQLDTATTPTFFGLNAAGGIWEKLGGPVGTVVVRIPLVLAKISSWG